MTCLGSDKLLWKDAASTNKTQREHEQYTLLFYGGFFLAYDDLGGGGEGGEGSLTIPGLCLN